MVRWILPAGVWTWGSTALVATMLGAPFLTILALLPSPRSSADVAAASGVLSYAVVIACAVFLYLHWRLTSTTSAAWLSAGMALVGIHGLTVSGLYLGGDDLHLITTFTLASDLLIGLIALGMARAADQVTIAMDPAALGLIGGLLVASLHVLVAHLVDTERGGPISWVWGTSIGLTAIGVVVAHRVGRICDLPPWARSRLGAAILALFLSRTLAILSTTESGPPVLAVVTGLAGTVLLCTTCLAMLRSAIVDGRASIASLQARIYDMEAHARADRERLHEVKGTIAGIASASDLIRRIAPSGQQRPGLEQMIARETARLNRLLHDEMPSPPEALDLDDLIRPLVLAHRARGHDVRWTATGHQVVAVADHLTEALNIVLNNAASHAAPGITRIEVAEDGGHVILRVCDNGPGVPEDIVDSVFEWGTRGVHSEGSGIGLHLACRLLSQDGHRLELDRSYLRGAAFLIDLGPAPAHST